MQVYCSKHYCAYDVSRGCADCGGSTTVVDPNMWIVRGCKLFRRMAFSRLAGLLTNTVGPQHRFEEMNRETLQLHAQTLLHESRIGKARKAPQYSEEWRLLCRAFGMEAHAQDVGFVMDKAYFRHSKMYAPEEIAAIDRMFYALGFGSTVETGDTVMRALYIRWLMVD